MCKPVFKNMIFQQIKCYIFPKTGTFFFKLLIYILRIYINFLFLYQNVHLFLFSIFKFLKITIFLHLLTPFIFYERLHNMLLHVLYPYLLHPNIYITKFLQHHDDLAFLILLIMEFHLYIFDKPRFFLMSVS